MLSLNAVNQYYGNQHTLWNVSLNLAPGECTCVMGLHGMGKTTLINCLLHRGRNVARGYVNPLDEPLLTRWMTPNPAH